MSTKLSTLLNRMDRYQVVQRLDNIYKVQDLDEAIRAARRICKFPWDLSVNNLKIFSGIYSYNPGYDFDGLAFLDDNGRYKTDKPEFQYTSIKQFYEDPNNRNLIAEIWEESEVKLGVKYKDAGLSQILIDDCSVIGNYSASGDFTAVEQEEIQTAVGGNSVKATCVESSLVATIDCNFTDFIDTEYKNKYFFIYIYFSSIPTSVDIKLKKDSLNYLSKNVLTQFDGSIFKAGEWNLLAFDLNDCTVEGTTEGEFNSYQISLNGAETGSYYFGETYLKEWKNLNYQYYSKNRIVTALGIKKEQFLNVDTNEYDPTDLLIGEDIYSDIILYEALTTCINEQENKTIFDKIESKRQESWNSLFEKYPDLQPDITTNYYNFVDNSDLGLEDEQIYV